MPGAEWPCMYTRSPPWPSDGACQKWLKPTSYSVAADWKLAMCPPSSEDSLLARSTIAIAFHRIIDRIVCSISWSPGLRCSFSGGIVFRYGLLAEYGTGAPLRRASSISSSSRKYARSGPSNSSTASRESSHSRVSAGSRSLGICPSYAVVASWRASSPRAVGTADGGTAHPARFRDWPVTNVTW